MIPAIAKYVNACYSMKGREITSSSSITGKLQSWCGEGGCQYITKEERQRWGEEATNSAAEKRCKKCGFLLAAYFQVIQVQAGQSNDFPFRM